jgi:predicted DNA-binding protein
VSMNMNIDVHLNMERGMYERLVERAQETGVPLSAVVRDAVAEYFENLPVPPDRSVAASIPDDPIWELPNLSATYGDLSVPAAPDAQNQGGTQA